MMHAVHFGAGNIGRGFIGEILAENGFTIDFVDINETLIDALHTRKSYSIELAEEAKRTIQIDHVDGLNNQKNPEAVVAAIANADIVTTAIGPNILPHIASLIAQGIQVRYEQKNTTLLDVIACENMIGGSQFLLEEVKKHISTEVLEYIERYIGFPNAAVDRIVPIQSHEDVLFVVVEPFKEWIIDKTQMKQHDIELTGVEYVDDLTPFIERKLFSVNTGHATVAYLGAYDTYKTIDEAIQDQEILKKLESALHETGSLLITKWHLDSEQHEKYIAKIIDRFKNPYISDDISRVARTPIRKLGYDERFIRPIRELKAHQLTYTTLLEVVAKILVYKDSQDPQSVELQEKLATQPIDQVIQEITELTDQALIDEIVAAYKEL